MQPLESAPPNEPSTIKDTVWRIGEEMRRLDPGSLAALRRIADDPLRAPHYWRWKARFGWHNRDDAWAAIIAIMAILTQKGRNPAKQSPHDQKNPLGKALCDGGDPVWEHSKPPRPKVSELRLAKLLNTRGPARQVALVRAIRAISRSGTPINCADVAQFLLHDEDERPAQKIAEFYYKRLDRAEHASTKTEEKDDQ